MTNIIKVLIPILIISCASNTIVDDNVMISPDGKSKITVSDSEVKNLNAKGWVLEGESKIKTKLKPENESSELILKKELDDSSFINDIYPIPGKFEISSEEYKTKRPKQLFSAPAINEIRLHKLGEVRWVYIGLEPSTAWPMILNFMEESNNLKLGNSDAFTGILTSKPFSFKGKQTKVELKIEPGLQQSSSEIFVTHLGSKDGLWEIIPSERSNLDTIVNELYEFLSSARPTSGTSLLALNLNKVNKTEVVTNDQGLREIKLRVNFSRAWASLRRSLLLAGYKIVDEDRNKGKFYLEYSVRRSLLDRRPSILGVEIIVKEISSKECLIFTNLDTENFDLSEEIISQINQSLS